MKSRTASRRVTTRRTPVPRTSSRSFSGMNSRLDAANAQLKSARRR